MRIKAVGKGFELSEAVNDAFKTKPAFTMVLCIYILEFCALENQATLNKHPLCLCKKYKTKQKTHKKTTGVICAVGNVCDIMKSWIEIVRLFKPFFHP